MEGKYHSTDYFDSTFDVRGYSEDCWGPEVIKADTPNKDFIDEVHLILEKLNLPDGLKQLEFGCGPSVHIALSSSRVASHIVMTEYASQNRQAVVEWLKNEDSAYGWKHMCEYIGQKEGRSAEEIETRTRRAIKEVLACDTEKEAIFGVAQLPQFDLVTSCLCLEAACKDLSAYNKAIVDLTAFLKPGGYIILSGVLNQSKYTVRNKWFYSLPINKADVNNALEAAGYENIVWYDHQLVGDYESFTDANGYFNLVAQKKK